MIGILFLRDTHQNAVNVPECMLGKGADGVKTISIIEFKYCKDVKQTRGPTGKMHDTTLLPNTSTSGRWVTGYKVELLVPVLIGHSGTIYTSNTLDNIK